MGRDIHELRKCVENIVEMNDESLAAKALYALDRLIEGWSDEQVAL